MRIDYSVKNIPIPPQKTYLKTLLDKTEHLIRRMRWAAWHFLHPKEEGPTKETYGFKTTNAPPQVTEMKEFEDKMSNMIREVTFTNTQNHFQTQLRNDVKKIKEEPGIIVAADKTTNYYRMDPQEYKNLLHNNVTSEYKTAHHNTVKAVQRAENRIVKELELEDRIEVRAEKEAYITLKDHKDNFRNRPSCRLINPSKSEVGKISKQILDRINNKVRQSTNVKQWKNSDEVIQWFNNIQDKPSHRFITFDIVSFYPSITEDLLSKALAFATQFTNISDREKSIILHAKKSFLFSNGKPWIKKANTSNNKAFDVTMGSFDGAETCDLVGLYLLSDLSNLLGNNVGLYRDDCLAVVNASNKKTEDIKKKICAIFRKHGLKITIEANKTVVDFLDVTFNLTNETYSPYMKPGNEPTYVHRMSNHPPTITKNIPAAINKRLSAISSNAEIFDRAAPPYQQAIRKSGYAYTLTYEPPTNSENSRRNRNRRRKTIWYNPPFSLNVRTNIGRRFLRIVDECFPRNHKLARIFNRNTLKISYSCMQNIGNIITGHNKAILCPDEDNNESSDRCNCQDPSTCPLPGNCNTRNIVYQATVTTNEDQTSETYIGVSAPPFKKRYNNHCSNFNVPGRRKTTELSKHIWSLRDRNLNYNIKWEIVAKGKPYSNKRKKCNLCLEERYYIRYHPEKSSLNRRDELTPACRHRTQYLIRNA